MAYYFVVPGVPSPQPGCFVGQAQVYPMEAYFPQEMFLELWRSNTNTLATPDPTHATPNSNAPASSGNAPTVPTPQPSPPGPQPASTTSNSPPANGANNDPPASPSSTNPTSNAPATAPSQAPTANPNPPTNPAAKYNVVHIIRYVPWAPTPSDERTECQTIGRCDGVREANECAMKEVYEKYGGLAHLSRGPMHPPNPNWIHKAGAHSEPNTWKIDDGRLDFSLVISHRLNYTLKGHIYIVPE